MSESTKPTQSDKQRPDVIANDQPVQRTIIDNKYVNLVDSCQRQVDRAWKVYATILAIGFAAITLSITFAGFFFSGSVAEFKRELIGTTRQRIDDEIKTTRIQDIIKDSVSGTVAVAVQRGLTEDARAASRNEARNEAKKIMKEEFQPLLTDLRQKQELMELIIQAENGDMKAFRKLEELAGIQVWEMRPSTPKTQYKYKDIARNVATRLFQKVNEPYVHEAQYIYLGAQITDEQVKQYLHSEDPRDRILAAHTIAMRNLTDQIPDLIAVLSTDDNLYVREAATRVLNKFLFDKYLYPFHAVRVLEPDAVEKFNKKYQEMKDNLKKTQTLK